jgi:hypothetical protein
MRKPQSTNEAVHLLGFLVLVFLATVVVLRSFDIQAWFSPRFLRGPDAVNCEHTVQSARIVADDRGRVCEWSKLDLQSSCCSAEQEQYACSTCDAQLECCSTFEYCVSCCMTPDSQQQERIEMLLESDALLWAKVDSVFEFCVAKCRTNSASVHEHNKYRNPSLKHCYGLHPAPVVELTWSSQRAQASDAHRDAQLALGQLQVESHHDESSASVLGASALVLLLVNILLERL